MSIRICTDACDYYAGGYVDFANNTGKITCKIDCSEHAYKSPCPFSDKPSKASNVQKHEKLCKELNELYERKNNDYGDSFHESFIDWGITMAAIRIGDKYNRLKRLCSAERAVKGESIRDTLIDLANYAIMTVMELDVMELDKQGRQDEAGKET